MPLHMLMPVANTWRSLENLDLHYVLLLNIGIDHRYVVQPWYEFLADSDFSHGDEVSFYYKRDKIWEIIIRRKKNWDDSDTE